MTCKTKANECMVLLEAGWSSSTNVEEESASDVHESEQEIVGRDVGVGEC